MSLHDLLIVAVVLYAALVGLYLTHAAAGGQLLCRLGLHELGPRRLAGVGGYWLACRRHCGHIESRADRRRQA